MDTVNNQKSVGTTIKVTYGSQKDISNRKNDQIVNTQKKSQRP